MQFAYADPPYRGCCSLYEHHHPDGLCWDDPETTKSLLARLNSQFDGWALSCKSNTEELAELIEWAGPGVRLGAWVKPFHIFKPNVNPSYGWEPVLFKGARNRTRQEPTIKDFHIENITLRKGLTGVKPPGFNDWIIQLLGVREEDTLVDLYPGKGGMAEAIARAFPPTVGVQ